MNNVRLKYKGLSRHQEIVIKVLLRHVFLVFILVNLMFVSVANWVVLLNCSKLGRVNLCLFNKISNVKIKVKRIF